MSFSTTHQIKKSEDVDLACESARRLINYRPRSESELRIRLNKKYSNDVVNECITKMYCEDFLNDKRFAQMYTDSRINSRHRSASTIRRELSVKGISKDISLTVTSEINDYEQALKVAQKKSRSLSTLPKDKFFQKMLSHLYRRGFNYTISKETTVIAWSQIQELQCNPSSDNT